MFNRLSAILVFALPFLVLSGLHAQAAIPPGPNALPPIFPHITKYTCAASQGYIVTIINPTWKRDRLGAAYLSINFTIKHADGTPVTFISLQGAISVFAWTDTNFIAGELRTSTASFDSQTNQWDAALEGVDPRNKTVHIDFEIRDPAVTSTQTQNIDSNFSFKNVPIPTNVNEREPLADEFTSPWGTKITLKGLTLVSGASGGDTTRFDFTADHPKVPDDRLSILGCGISDNGAMIPATSPPPYSAGHIGGADNTLTLIAPKLAPGNTSLTFDFDLQEASLQMVKSIAWKAVQMEIPLNKIPGPGPSESFKLLGQTTQGTVKYRIDTVNDPDNSPYNYVLWTKSADPTHIYRVTGAQWAAPAKQKTGTGRMFNNMQPNLYWHADGSPLSKGEYGTIYTYNNQGLPAFPLHITAQLTSHDQQTIAFSKVPVPAIGQTLILDQNPDTTSSVPIRLRSVALVMPFSFSQESQHSSPIQIRLTFEYKVADGSDVSLFTLAASDSEGNSLNHSYENPMAQMMLNWFSDRSSQTTTVNIAVPPSGSKTIDLSFILTKDTPIGSPTYFSIDSGGKWTAIDTSLPPEG